MGFKTIYSNAKILFSMKNLSQKALCENGFDKKKIKE